MRKWLVNVIDVKGAGILEGDNKLSQAFSLGLVQEQNALFVTEAEKTQAGQKKTAADVLLEQLSTGLIGTKSPTFVSIADKQKERKKKHREQSGVRSLAKRVVVITPLSIIRIGLKSLIHVNPAKKEKGQSGARSRVKIAQILLSIIKIGQKFPTFVNHARRRIKQSGQRNPVNNAVKLLSTILIGKTFLNTVHHVIKNGLKSHAKLARVERIVET